MGLSVYIYNQLPIILAAVGMTVYLFVSKRETKSERIYIFAIIATIFVLVTCEIGNQFIRDYYDSFTAAAIKYKNLAQYSSQTGIEVIDYRVWLNILSAIGYFCRTLVVCLLWLLITNRKQKLPVRIAAHTIIFTEVLLLLTSPFTKWFYYFDALNYHFHEGPLYFLLYLAPFFFVGLIIAEAVYRYQNNFVRNLLFIILLVVFYLGTAILESFMVNYGGNYTLNNVIIMCLVFYYLLVHSATLEEDVVDRERQIIERENSLKLSQIRPHFIFNTLTSIIDLCEEDSPAQKALYAFSRYLRTNIDTIGCEKAVLFANELAHVKTFIELEQYSYGDRLTVDYDIANGNFLLPSMTVEPLVENSVKHGFKTNHTINILIKAYDDSENYYVEVIDNGPGFDEKVKPYDNKRHIGIENIRYRLRELSTARLDYYAVESGGTRAVITLPKGENK